MWVTGASHGIGRALVETVPWPDARVIGVSRGLGGAAVELQADLSDPRGWTSLGASFRDALTGFCGDRVVCVHAAATIDPVGRTGETDQGLYRNNVLLNAAAPMVIGEAFLREVQMVLCRRQLVLLSSGAAHRPYPGLAAYGGAKAAVDQWVRTVGAEQSLRGGVQVLSVTPGRVGTAMHERLRAASHEDLPDRTEFIRLREEGGLSDPRTVAEELWNLLLDSEVVTGSVVDLRDRRVDKS